MRIKRPVGSERGSTSIAEPVIFAAGNATFRPVAGGGPSATDEVDIRRVRQGPRASAYSSARRLTVDPFIQFRQSVAPTDCRSCIEGTPQFRGLVIEPGLRLPTGIPLLPLLLTRGLLRGIDERSGDSLQTSIRLSVYLYGSTHLSPGVRCCTAAI